MAVAGVAVGSKIVEFELAGAVGAVDHADDAGVASPPAELGRRKDERRIRRDVAEEEDTSARRDRCPDSVGDLVRAGHGQRHMRVMMRAPVRRAISRQTSAMAPYSRSVMTTSSPRFSGTDAATAFNAVVELWSKTRRAGSTTPTCPASRALTLSRASGKRRARNSTGRRSSCRRRST